MDFNEYWDWLQFESPNAEKEHYLINEVLRYSGNGDTVYVMAKYQEYKKEHGIE